MMSALRGSSGACCVIKFSGVPAVYIQSILGSRNDYEGVERLGYNRAINRKKYTAGQVDRELNNNKSIRYQIYSRLSELIAIRRGERAFHPDSQAIFDAIGEHILKIVRVAENGERMTALFNFSNKMQTVYGQTLFGRELLSGQDISGTELTLNPWQVMWIKEN